MNTVTEAYTTALALMRKGKFGRERWTDYNIDGLLQPYSVRYSDKTVQLCLNDTPIYKIEQDSYLLKMYSVKDLREAIKTLSNIEDYNNAIRVFVTTMYMPVVRYDTINGNSYSIENADISRIFGNN